MSDKEESSNGEQQPQEETSQETAPAGGLAGVAKHMLANKIDTALWASRIITLFFSISYFLPFFSYPDSSYQKVLLSNAATSALRLQQRTRLISLNREFIMQVMAEDSFHYLLYSINFLPCGPVTLVLVPIMLFALLHFASYTLLLCDLAGRNNALAPRFLIGLVEFQQRNILRGAAFIEIFLMPLTIINLFFGRVNLVTPIVVYQFLLLRYQSRRNPYTRAMFCELRRSAEHFSQKSFVPAAVRTLLLSTMARIASMAPEVHQ